MSQPTTHSVFSPSSAHRWLECQGSVELLMKYGLDDAINDYTTRGTRIHEWAAWILTHYDSLEAYTDLVNSATCNADILGIEEAKNYVEYVASYYEPGDQIGIESKVCLGSLYPEMKGYVDAFIIKKQTQEIHIFDLKTGFINITARNNPQLMLYAYGVLTNYTDTESIKNIRLHIVQCKPNYSNNNMCTITVSDLMSFIAGVRSVIDDIKKGSFGYKEGEYCKYCPVSTHCKKVKESMSKVCKDIENVDIESESIDKLSELVYNYTKYESVIEKCKQRIKQSLEDGKSNDYFTLQTRKAFNQNWNIPDHRIFTTLYEKYPFFFELMQNENEDITQFFTIKLPSYLSLRRALYNRRDLDEHELSNILTYLQDCQIPDEEAEKVTILKRKP